MVRPDLAGRDYQQVGRKIIATVFKGTINRMINGYLLRDVKLDALLRLILDNAFTPQLAKSGFHF
jgi:hypothetical protein